MRKVCTAVSIASSRLAAARDEINRPSSRGSAWPTRRPPVEVMISVRLRTSSGWSSAAAWAMKPPMEAPTTCTGPSCSASTRPRASRAMSLTVYGGRRRRATICAIDGARTPRKWVLAPTSRLSNRTTWWPRSARSSHSSSGHAIICVPSPMTSRTGGAPGSPKVSYAISMPFAGTFLSSGTRAA